MPRLTEGQYGDLLGFRVALRRFNRWSEDQARSVGLTHAQHQLLLAVRGHPDARGPTMSDVAEYLLLRHHSAVELTDRAEAAGLVERVPDDDDGRIVRLRLTETGRAKIQQLTPLHLAELRRLAPLLDHLTEGPDPAESPR
jgi:DNA-binding MarR family transcriptional regulator